MKKQRTRHINLAQMTESEMKALMSDNEMDAPELFAILEALFEMFTTSIHFSRVVFQYGHEHHPDFVPTFLQHAVSNRGVNPQQMIDILQAHSTVH